MIMTCLLYLVLGFSLDILVTLHVKAVTTGRVASSVLLSMTITLISVLLIQNLVVSFSLSLVMSYAFGTGMGTLIGMKVSKIKELLRVKIS